MLSGRSTYKATAPAQPPMGMDAGKPSARDALFAGGVTVAFWAAAAVGGWLAALFGPHGYEGLGDIGAPRLIGWGFGLLLGLAGFWLGLDFARLTRRGWLDYQQRLADWHAAAIDAYTAGGGQVTEELTNEWELRADRPDQVWFFITAMHQLASQGQDAPWALRRLVEDGVWLGGRKLAINTHQARLMVGNLETMGLIVGRSERQAGRWAPESIDEALALFERGAKKVL